jgi:two-component system, chemotaxis family, protein-glutamate methylesterase/glutaminase
MHVLIVDDSAVVRQTVSAILDDEPDISVSVASDPLIALQKIDARRPDVILLDIAMPRMDGITFLGKLMAEDPIPVVVCSAVAGPRSEAAVLCLRHGALDIVAKPKIGVRDFLRESRVILVDALRAAAAARPVERRPPSAAGCARENAPRSSVRRTPDDRRVVAIGASTGGTEALRAVLSALPPDTPGTLIVQHMPEGFTSHFARHLDHESPMEVREAVHGDRLYPGRALLAPGNRHMALRRDRDGYYVALDDGPLVSRHRPSVDVLFHSVAEIAGATAVGVLLTGMGADGAEGLLALKKAGASTIAQDERTSVVFGMPKEAIARGAAGEITALDRIAASIRSAASHPRKSPAD